jgi:hypothetical protein
MTLFTGLCVLVLATGHIAIFALFAAAAFFLRRRRFGGVGNARKSKRERANDECLFHDKSPKYQIQLMLRWRL